MSLWSFRKSTEIFLLYLRRMGFLQGIRWIVIRNRNERKKFQKDRVSVEIRGIEHPVIVRMQDSSDPQVFDNIFINRELGFAANIPPARLVVDLGANVGYAAIYFLNTFPGCRVIAVEPDPANYEMCAANLKPYGDRVDLVLGAVWHTKTALVLSRGTFGDGRAWATEVRAALPGEQGDVQAWDIPSLLQRSGREDLDLLKIDIEGSEDALFSQNTHNWLPRVKNICVELHGPDCALTFLTALKPYRFRYARSGEYTLCLNINPKSDVVGIRAVS